MSTRDKRPVNYNSMAAGTGEISASMDYAEVSGQNARAVQKKASISDPAEVKRLCDQIFQLLKCHGSAPLLLEPLDPTHPNFSELKDNFINLHKIELNFRNNKYSTTFALGLDFNKMWVNATKMYAGD